MPGSKGDKSEPKEANVVVFAAAEDSEGGGSLGRFPWGFMAGLEKGKCYHVISSKHSANSRILLWSNTIQGKNELTSELESMHIVISEE